MSNSECRTGKPPHRRSETVTRTELQTQVIGGPTVVIDYEGLRFVTDPTFDPPTDYGALQKLEGPTVDADSLGPVDAVLISHDLHPDNLDAAGRRFALRAPLILTTPSAAERLGGAARGLSSWQSWSFDSGVTVTAVPAEHGPADGERDAQGFINCETTGFLLQSPRGKSIYVSGDNASLRIVRSIADRFGQIDFAILFAGAASVPSKFSGRPLSLTAERAVAAAEILGVTAAVIAHERGWAHFTEGPARTLEAFNNAGLSELIINNHYGQWDDLGPATDCRDEPQEQSQP